MRDYSKMGLDELREWLKRIDAELDEYDMMEYTWGEGLAISSLVATRQTVQREIDERLGF